MTAEDMTSQLGLSENLNDADSVRGDLGNTFVLSSHLAPDRIRFVLIERIFQSTAW